MRDYSNNVDKAKEIMKVENYYNSIATLMGWDLWQGLTKDGQSYRDEVSAFFMKKSLELMKDTKNQKLVEYFRELDDSEYKDMYEKALGRTFVKKYDRTFKVPVDLQIEMSNFTSKAQMVWREAREKSDFAMYKPYLKKLFELKKKVAESLDDTKNPFDVLVDDVDQGLSVENTGKLFAELKDAIVVMLKKIEGKNIDVDDKILDFDVDKEKLKNLGIELLSKTGFNKNRGSFAEVVHPVCYSMGPKDSRITFSYGKLMPSLLSFLHEGGHGMYSYSANEKAIEYELWGGISGAVHESQSRFYENIIGKSYEYWQCFYPMLQDSFENLRHVGLDEFYKALNKVSPSLKRLDADELTYSLHPIIRFEMEKDYFDGKIKTDDFYEIWNSKYKEYLGLEPQNASEGVLQDVHWASGHVGYFQSYTMGNIWDGQIRNKMLKEIPNLYSEIKIGNFDPLNKWLCENIHQYSRAYTPDELCQKLFGEELKSKYFIDYLDEKYSKIYEI